MKKLFLSICTIIALIVSCEKTPEEIAISTVTLGQSTAEMIIGETVQLTATITPSNATDKTIQWASSKQSVATITNSGLVSAIAEGQSTITASAGGKSATCLVTVSKGVVAVTSVSLNKTELSLTKGQSETLAATVKPDDATDKTVAWASSDSAIATVDASGKVTAVAGGNAVITAKAGNQEAICPVVVSVPVESVSLNKTELSLEKGNSETLTATITPSDATDKKVDWSSSNTAIATVDVNGKVTAVAGGSATITAKVDEKTATCSITVTVPVESVSLDKTNLTLEEGASDYLTATINPSDATDKTVSWSSSDSGKATVDSNGKVIAVKEGTAIITVHAGDKKAECSVTVQKKVIDVNEITLDKENATLFVGNTFTLNATVLPNDATDQNVTWTSSNSSVATVENGVVTGVGIGTTVITATAGNKSATCSILVVKDSADGVYARYYGGAMSIINGKIQSGSQLNFGVVNYSSEAIRVVSVQLIDGQTGSGGNVMSLGADIVSGSSSAWTITIGAAGIYEPTARFVYTFRGETYTCEAQYTVPNWGF